MIKEARRRARRRRLRWAAGIAVLAGIGAAIYTLTNGHPALGVARGSTQPVVDSRAFRGHGDLAFISRGSLWVLDGQHQRLRRLPVPQGMAPSSPVFSHDGQWLAYSVSRRSPAGGSEQLWLARADGSRPHKVNGLVVNQFVGWSPRRDLLLVTLGHARHPPYGLATALALVSPSAPIRTLALGTGQRQTGPRGAIWSALWSPGGNSVAVSTYSTAPAGGTQIIDVPVTGHERPTVWFTIHNRQRLSDGLGCGHCGDDEGIAQLAGWWPKWGIGFWVYDSGMTHNSDSTPLAVIPRAGAQPRLLAHTLSDGMTDAVSAGAEGELAVVASSASSGRDYPTGKTVQTCSASTFRCRALPGASTWSGAPLPCHPCVGAPATGLGSAVSLDPAWSPDSRQLAYVKAPAYRAGADPDLAWFRAHQLYLWNGRAGVTHRLGSIDGSSLPTWSQDGRSLLYVSGDGLWLVDGSTHRPVEIAHPLYREAAWKRIGTSDLSFFGQIPWGQQFSWSSS